MKIIFSTALQKLIWDKCIIPQIDTGVWANSNMHNKMVWLRADTYSTDNTHAGTDIPKFETRYDFFKDEFLFVHGWSIIAYIRVHYSYNAKVSVSIPESVRDLIEHIIAIDDRDQNKDYRISQVRSVSEMKCRVQGYNTDAQKRFSKLVLDAKSKGFELKDIISVLKIECYDKRSLNRDIQVMIKDLKTKLVLS